MRRIFPLILLSAACAPALVRAQDKAPASAAANANPLSVPHLLDFSRPADAAVLTPYAAPGGVSSGATVELADGALRIRNRTPGSFGVQLNVTPLDVDQITDLSFDFKASPDARINWFFKVGARYFGVHFTGPTGVRPGATFLGDAEISDAANGWKHAHIPLRGWLRAAMPDETSVVIDEILIGNWDNEGYLMAGIGGNGPGAQWQMDDLRLEKRAGNAQFGPARWQNQSFVLPARDLASFDFKDLTLQIDGMPKMEIAEQFFDPTRGLVVDIAAMGDNTPRFKDGQSVGWKLTRGADNAPVAAGAATLSYADLGAPPLPTLRLEGVAADASDDWEFGPVALWQSSDKSTRVETDASTAASGARSLRLTNARSASAFAVGLGKATLDAAQFPVLTFAYRADDRLRADMTFKWMGKTYSVRFTDRDNPNARLASIGGVKADNQWHLATVNLLAALQKARVASPQFDPNATPDYVISDIKFSDAGWLGNAKGVQWWLDDWRPAPHVEGTLQGKVAGRDLSGLSGVSYVLDQNPASKPDETTRSGPDLQIPLEGKQGLWWLHVRARDGAGKWSDTANYPLWLGDLPTPPAPPKPKVEPKPAPAAPAAPAPAPAPAAPAPAAPAPAAPAPAAPAPAAPAPAAPAPAPAAK